VRRRTGGRTRVNLRVMPRHVEGPGEGWRCRAEVRDVPLECGGCRPLIGKRSGEHHGPRGIEGAHSVRVLRMWNVETPSGSSPLMAGRPTARKAQSPAGNRMTREANAGAPKGDGKDVTGNGRLLAVVGVEPAGYERCARPEREPTRVR